MPLKRFTLFNLPIVPTKLYELVKVIKQTPKDQCLIVSFINPHSFYLAKKNVIYKNLLDNLDIILPDGVAVKKAAEKFLECDCDRISFDSTSLSKPIFEWAEKEQKKIILAGGKEGVAELAAENIRSHYPEIQFEACLNGYIPKEELLERIIKISPDIVICGMGAPHQEDLLIKLKNNGWKGIGFTCGGYLDQLSSGMQYYPVWVDRANLRFLYRIYKEPRRLWKRYFIEYGVFILLYLNASIKMLFEK